MEIAEKDIPADIKEMPADENGDGFVFADIWGLHHVGSDGRIYTRKKGKITVAEEDTTDDFRDLRSS